MVRVDLKGINKTTAKGRTYYYAWRKEKGSPEQPPRLVGEPGSPDFVHSYYEAIENRRTPDTDRFRSVITLYKSTDYKLLSPSTKQNWGPWLDRISDYFGDLRTAQFDRPEKIRPVIRRWRSQWADKRRTADYGMQVLSRVLAYAVELGKIAGNPCQGIKQLYTVDRSELIWTDADQKQLFAGSERRPCPQEIIDAVDLASHTGLRLGDLLRLSWSHVGEDAIELTTGKSKHKRLAMIPLYDALRALLERIPKRSTVILTNSRGRPWKSEDSFGSAFNRAKIAAGMGDRDLHFHDLRGTACTRFYVAELSVRVIAEVMGWEEDHVSKIIRRYVDRKAITRAIIKQLNERST
jgi:integrase